MTDDLPPSDRPAQRQVVAVRRGRRPGDDPVALGLRKLWQEVELEPVPDEFMDLLDAIDVAKTGVATPPAGEPDDGGNER